MMIEFTNYNRSDCETAIIGEIISHNTTTKKRKLVLECPSAFDTEVSSFYNDVSEVGLCYIWMFGLGDSVFYGRTMSDLTDFVYLLNKDLSMYNVQIYCYVHNFKYDWQFIKQELPWEKVFAKSKRDILFANCGNIEFRDSLVLAGGASLDFIGKHLRDQTYQKAVGNLDYSLLRTPSTPLSEKELYYCEMDIRVLEQYIQEKIEDEGTITTIPYTNTGYVRRYVKNKCFENRKQYLETMDGLTITPDTYALCERAFMGGAVGANIKHIGKIIYNVASYDIKSSYPYVMVTGYYPMSYGRPVPNDKAIEVLFSNKYCCIFTLELFSLVPKPGNTYCFPISESKCRQLIGAVTGSGRVMSALYLKIDCTELDFQTFCEFYDILGVDNSTHVELSTINTASFKITNMRAFTMGFLPKPIVESVFEFFNRKTTLDGVKGKEAEYMISKNMLNAIYGMMVEKPVRPEFEFIEGLVQKENPDYIEQVEHYNNKWDRFLYYPWGVYVTAHARRRLYQAIHAVGDDFIYCDTDSVKFINYEKHMDYFNKVNKQAENKMILTANRVHLPLEFCMPKAPNGDIKCLGVWEHEFTADKFKTLGAKRYMYEVDNKLKLTVAGSNKKSTLEYLQTFDNPFEKFSENLVVPVEYAKRIVATFIDKEQHGFVTDYLGNECYYTQKTGIHMRNSTYSFSITDNTKELIAVLIGDADLTQPEIE